MGPGPLTR